MQPEKSGEIPNLAIDVDVKKHPNGIWTLDVLIGEKREIVPFYHIREDSHKKLIARALVSGEPVCAFGVGNYGLAIGVEDPRRGRTPNAWRGWWNFKPERPFENKVPILLPWKYWSRVIDLRKLDRTIRPLFTYERLEHLYRQGIVFHIKAESYDSAPYIDERAFVQVEHGRKMISVLLWDDPNLYEVADEAVRLDRQILVGISSYNPHEEKPAFNFEEVVAMVYKTGKLPFKYGVRDEVGEAIAVESSMAIFVVEGDHFYEQRAGSTPKEEFLAATGLDTYVRSDEKPKYAARNRPEDVNLFPLVQRVQKESYEDYFMRRKKKR